MKFSIYGRFTLEVQREGDAWVVYEISPGKRVRSSDVVVPADLDETELPIFLDDLFHELSQPGQVVQRLK